MSKLTALKNVSLIVALVVAVYLVANYTGSIKNEVMQTFDIPGASVKGASTKRAEELTQKIKNDLISQLGTLEEKVLQLTLSDAIDNVSKLQKIPKDIHDVSEFAKQAIDDVLQSKK